MTSRTRGPADPRYYPPRPPAEPASTRGWPTTPATPATAERSRSNPTPSANRYLPPLDEPPRPHTVRPAAGRRGADAGERVTVTRAAAQRSREMGSRMYGLVHRAATADGADKSGLTALT